jgi:hypothetical protein
MPNLNSSECGCMGIYNASTNSCDDIPEGIDPCPNSWWSDTISNAQTWDWNNISSQGQEWAYILGLADRPVVANTGNQNEIKTSTYIMYGVVALTLVMLVMYFIMKKKK